MEELYVGEYREQDIPYILKLFSISFQKDATKEWFLWKYQSSPWGSKGYVVIVDKMVVAFYGGIKLQFSLKGKILWAYQFCDVMTHPEYRGMMFGKNPLIIRAARLFHDENAMDFALGFPSERHARLQTKLMGATSYRRIIGFRKKLHPKKNRSMSYRRRLALGWQHLSERDMDMIWNRCSKELSLAVVKSSSYMTWRYRRNPAGEYAAVVLKGFFSNRPRAYAVVKIAEGELHVLEFLIPDKGLHRHFWNMLEYTASDLRATAIATWANVCEPAAVHLVKSGYDSFEGIPYGVRIVGEGISQEDFYGEYYYRMGDYDAS